MIQKIKFQQLPKNDFAFACMELDSVIDNALNANRRYYAEFKWGNNLKQQAFKNFLANPLTTNIQHFALSGSVGAGKSMTPIAWFYELMDAYPGCKILGLRRTHGQLMSSLFAQVKLFNERYGIQASYRESAIPYPRIMYKNGSQWIFHSSESVMDNQNSDTARGLGSTEYSGALIEEADMVHLAAVDTVPQRLREPSGVPVRVIVYVYNPTTEDHWIHKRFKLKDPAHVSPEHKDDYNHLKFTMEDNRKNLTPGFIESQIAHYKNKPALYRRMILGEAGPVIMGTPIYADYFDRRLHIAPESFIGNWTARKHWEDGPICLGFDFGFRHPVIFITQDVKIGKFTQLRLLAAWKGDHQTLRPFTQFYLDLIKPIFPNAEYLTYGDPAGRNADARGVTAENAFDVLASLGLKPQTNKTVESVGVDIIIEMLKKIEPHRVLGPQPALVVEPDLRYTQDIIDMFEIGFCQNNESKGGKFDPVDDDNYIHFADALRYVAQCRRSAKNPNRSTSGVSLSGFGGDRPDYMPLRQNDSGSWVGDTTNVQDMILGGWDGH